MKIKELKEILSKLDENLDVFVGYDSFVYNLEVRIDDMILIDEYNEYFDLDEGLYFCCESDLDSWFEDSKFRIEGRFVKDVIND